MPISSFLVQVPTLQPWGLLAGGSRAADCGGRCWPTKHTQVGALRDRAGRGQPGLPQSWLSPAPAASHCSHSGPGDRRRAWVQAQHPCLIWQRTRHTDTGASGTHCHTQAFGGARTSACEGALRLGWPRAVAQGPLGLGKGRCAWVQQDAACRQKWLQLAGPSRSLAPAALPAPRPCAAHPQHRACGPRPHRLLLSPAPPTGEKREGGQRKECGSRSPCLLPSRSPNGLTQMSCFSPIGKFEYRSTISGVRYMGVVFLVT